MWSHVAIGALVAVSSLWELFSGQNLTGEQWWQVSVGPYASTAAADADLARIREIPGYEDATLRAVSRP